MTKRQQCVEFCKQNHINVSGDKSGVCVAAKDGAWVTAFSDWDNTHGFLMQVRAGADPRIAARSFN